MKRKELLKAIKSYLVKRRGQKKSVKNVFVEVKRPDDGNIEEFDGKTAMLLNGELIIADYFGHWKEPNITNNGLQAIAEALGVYIHNEEYPEIDLSIADYYNVLCFNVPAPIYRGYHISLITQEDGSIEDEGRWIESDDFSFSENEILIFDCEESGLCSPDNYVIDPTSLGEYIGINDKNGKRIFTGDIILNGNCGTWVVEPMSRGSFSLKGACREYQGDNYCISFINKEAIVIGNIYAIREQLENNQLESK